MEIGTRRIEDFKLLGLTLPGLLDPAPAIATSRAGGIGILNLECTEDERAAREAIAKLALYAGRECGIKIDGNADDLLSRLMPQLPERIKMIILTATDRQRLQDELPALHKLGITVLLEVTNVEQAKTGEAAGVDGLIAKGNEAAGWVGEETTFILLQRLLAQTSLPVWAQGGIGLHTAGACFVAGAEGIVLDSQLLLARESSLPETIKAHIARMDGSESLCLGSHLGLAFRTYARPGMGAVEELQKVARSLESHNGFLAQSASIWRQEVKQRIGWNRLEDQVWPLGQDAAFAAPLAKQFRTVGRIVQGYRVAIEDHLRAAKSLRPLDKGSPLARSHRTDYPLVQGPMTRVSDTAMFAAEVAGNGALPFLALALMHAREVRALLEETRQAVGDKPWGVGILGFVPVELRQEQLEVILACKPPFALIAGGRPDQALMLERAGIPTYLHVPSPGLLKLFIENGARRFVLEGRECGGHVGPRSSFVLWNQMVDVLLQATTAEQLADCHVLFAGGIHDAVSSSMVAAVAAPLAERGARIGVLLGTAYLFTSEAVASGAIVEGFQRQAITCARTVLLESGPGHATRCAETAFVDVFEGEKRQLLSDHKSAEEIRNALEELNVGRLRIASKAIDRHPAYGQDPKASKFIKLNEEEQRAQGMYMIGQLAALRHSTCTIAELHREVSVKGSDRLTEIGGAMLRAASSTAGQKPCDVAIIGMACMMPKAPNLRTYWENILHKVDAIDEVPRHRWDWSAYYDADPKTRDKVNSRWGGFIEEVPFDPLRYGIPPNTIPSIEPVQLLTLEVVRGALEDAGYLDRAFARHRTAVVFGMGGGAADLSQKYAFRAWLPNFIKEERPDLLSELPEWTSDSFAGTLMSVAAGRIANRFDLGGVNYTVDAACASSLAALDIATRELESGTSDMVIVGGVDTDQCPVAYLGFSKTHTLSRQGRCRSFDETADGIVISEGLAVLVLKRLADAERDGDRIYAVIKAVGGSSDGRDKSLTAPRPEGQAVALERAYAKAGWSPATVSLIEAHGTGTPAGDPAEAETLKRVFEAAGARRQSCAIGSVKSMIGHTKRAAGAAGLIKVAKALYHKILPPTLHVERPNPKIGFSESPFYVNTEARPWIGLTADQPRRAGVSAFGFGGTNFHAVLEEYRGDFITAHREAPADEWPAELLLWARRSPEQLLDSIRSVDQLLAGGANPSLRDLAYTLWQAARDDSTPKLAIVASSIEDLRPKLARVRQALERQEAISLNDPNGVYLIDRPLATSGKVAFLFPGQGSQYPGMLADLAMHFSEARESFESADRVLDGKFPQALSAYIFPPPGFSVDEQRAHEQALKQTHIAQPALGASAMALLRLYEALGVKPEMVAGHSYGEYVALCSAGVLSEETLYLLSEARGRAINESSGEEPGTMAAVMEGAARVGEVIQSIESVWVANLNAPRQTVISGTREGIALAVERLTNQGIQARPIPVACAFHTPIIAAAQRRLAGALSATEFAAPRLPVFSNTTAADYADDPDQIADLLAEHLIRPVRFSEEIQQMYVSGARLFVEVGPRSVLTGLTDQILGEQPHVAIASDVASRPSLVQLLHGLGQLAAHGVNVNLDRLFNQRSMTILKLDTLEAESQKNMASSAIWLIDGGRARPAFGAAPKPASSPQPAPVQPAAAIIKDSKMKRTSEAEQAFAQPHSTAQPSSALEPKSKPGDGRVSHHNGNGAAGNGHGGNGHTGNGHGGNGLASIPVNALAENGEVGQVMAGFQRLMNHFLDTQRNVMLAYLHGSNGASEHQNGHASSAGFSESLPSADVVYKLPELAAATPVAPAKTPANIAPVQTVARLLETEMASSAHGVVGPVSEAAPRDASGREQVAHTLIGIVSERTGYPPDMLNIDVNLEADLGIDSIKHVEILAVLQQSFSPAFQQKIQECMDMLVRTKTLRGILDLLAPSDEEGRPEKKKLNPPDHRQQTAIESIAIEPEKVTETPRFILKPVQTYPSRPYESMAIDGVILITDDERGIARTLAATMGDQQGARSVLVRRGDAVAKLSDGLYTANLTDRQQATELLDLIRRHEGRIAALLHLLPLSEVLEFEKMSLSDWQARARLEVNSLLNLTQAAASDLKHSATARAGRLLAATSLGNVSGRAATGRPPVSLISAGVAGLVKTLSLEWPDVACTVAHLDLNETVATLAGQLIREIATDGREPEVFYQAGGRYTMQSEKAALEARESNDSLLGPDSVILITGGARGITATATIEMARQYHPTLILIGRSPLPPAHESIQTAELAAPREIKAAIIEELRRAGDAVTPARVEACYTRLMQDREIRRNLLAIQQAGGRVEYQQVDVRDGLAFEQIIKDIYRAHGRLDGVIHGAGIIEDKLIEDKTPDSFDRVFHTKVTGAFVLARNLRPDLRFLIFFSSVAGAFGSRGQADYAAANEVLNKLAVYLDAQWPGRVTSINWGPWEGLGMVSEEVRRQFAERGVQMITPEAGRRALDKEIRLGRKGEVEVVLGNGPWETDRARWGASTNLAAHS
jgi:acyl transferase domain-containing protein/NAD(P)H-dependent flavin oxidoreductase YrpB (nitropropane dioxygenase family)/NAD(P)-dependent dehydrogenase (short-subunit alcohol dehydrogenase family)/acyl carrier protein